MKFEEFAKQVAEKYNGKFPYGYCCVKKYYCLGNSITIRMYMNDLEGLNSSNVAADNDMLRILFDVQLPDKFNFEADELPENLIMEAFQKDYWTKPDKDYFAFGRKTVAYRKTSGTPEKLVKTVEKFIEKLHKMIAEDLKNDNIHANHVELVKKNLEA